MHSFDVFSIPMVAAKMIDYKLFGLKTILLSVTG